jgi:1-acyl-sn-glycerol-3-phosphate acyltransferase
MVAGQVLLVVLAGWNVGPIPIFGGLAVVNLLVGLYMYSVVPEFLLRFVCWCLSFLVYRLDVRGHANVPAEGPCVLVCNHVSFVDWFVLAAAIRRPARFVMWKGFFNLPVVKVLFRQAKVIPIGSGKEDPAALERSFDRISAELRDGQVVCIFPEGALTQDGEMLPFRKGIERIIARDPVPVVPMALNGLWGSYFSRSGPGAMKQPFRRVYSRVLLSVGPPVPPERVSAEGLQDRVAELWREGLARAGA